MELSEREIEIGILGALLKKPANIGSVSEIIQPDYFTWQPYKDCYLAMLELSKEGMGIDSITIGDHLANAKKLNDFSLHDAPSTTGRAAIAYIRQEGRQENATTYAQIAKNYAQNRVILEILSNGAKWVESGRNPSEIVGDITKKLGSIDASSTVSKSTITFNDAISKAWDMTEEAGKGNATFLQTGFKFLDRMMIGLSAPDMTIVAARPGVGKTAFLATVVFNVMTNYPTKRIAFFSLEMGSEQVAMRFVSMFSGISYNAQRMGKFKENEYDLYVSAVEQLTSKNYPLFLNDLPGLKPNKIRQELRRLGDIDLVVLDYIQLAESDEKREQRHLEVASVSKALKGIAKEFHVPVLVAAQLKRAADNRAGELPVMSDLAESGSLERDADNIIFLHREFGKPETFVTLVKQRNGPVGETVLLYDGDRTMFKDKP